MLVHLLRHCVAAANSVVQIVLKTLLVLKLKSDCRAPVFHLCIGRTPRRYPQSKGGVGEAGASWGGRLHDAPAC